MNPKIKEIKDEIKKIIAGKDDIIEKVLCALLADGHILLEDIPGVGKTTLALALSRALSLDFNRVQFTPDVLPSDIVGFTMFNPATKEFEYRKGTVLCNLFLADEINRTSPKTQSALLEVMEEGSVTVEGVSYKAPSPFIVIATQNPFGSSGTQRLPESQLDRFMIRLTIGYPEHDDAIEVLKGTSFASIDTVNQVVSLDEVQQMKDSVKNIFVDDSIYEYIITLTEATRNPNQYDLGLSPRGSLALLAMAKAAAFIAGYDYVLPEHVVYAFFETAIHRVHINARAKAQGMNERDVLAKTLQAVHVPKTTHN